MTITANSNLRLQTQPVGRGPCSFIWDKLKELSKALVIAIALGSIIGIIPLYYFYHRKVEQIHPPAKNIATPPQGEQAAPRPPVYFHSISTPPLQPSPRSIPSSPSPRSDATTEPYSLRGSISPISIFRVEKSDQEIIDEFEIALAPHISRINELSKLYPEGHSILKAEISEFQSKAMGILKDGNKTNWFSGIHHPILINYIRHKLINANNPQYTFQKYFPTLLN